VSCGQQHVFVANELILKKYEDEFPVCNPEDKKKGVFGKRCLHNEVISR
jgi:hypothetical protein